MKSYWGALAILLVLPIAGAGAADDAANSVRLNRVVLDTDNAATDGHVKGGTMCVSSEPFSWVGFSGRELDRDRYDHLFSGKMTDAGFTVVSTSRDLFAEAREEGEANFLIGAIMLPRIAELCITAGQRIKGRVVSDVEFQIFDNGRKEVVYTKTHQGVVEYPKFRRDANFGTMLEDSFSNAVARFSADSEVRTILAGSSVSSSATASTSAN